LRKLKSCPPDRVDRIANPKEITDSGFESKSRLRGFEL
jgi:hypothetical protein